MIRIYYCFRCLYQLNIWYNSHIPNMPLEDPTLYGWTLEENIWKANFSSQEPVPDNVRTILSIRCSDKNCNNNKCTCISQGLKCCIDCKYTNCCNSLTNEILSDCEDEDF
ncbi:unnamed protein product [Psylliodes chrysocephalus]|uniref:Uncharacterized protein n=1 Tax=Psylliodes chrysocephalus TaxID=3402493 RepID=A0A9P0GGF1_9CUCU|nr:unnamed protein product [Psylliodes chrysocephala]